MNISSKTQFSPLLESLYRLEASSNSIQDRRKLVEFFCNQVIPFINRYTPIFSFLEKLRTDYRNLQDTIKMHEINSMIESKKALRQIERDLKISSPLSSEIELCLKRAPSRIFKNQFQEIHHPTYRIYEEAVEGVLEILLKAGFKDICAKHAKLLEVDECIQKNPTERHRWALCNSQGKAEFFPAECFSESDKANISSLLSIPPEMEHVKLPRIHFFTFNPSSGKVLAAAKRTYWEQLHDPAVVWRYFELAHEYWNTSSSYFEDKLFPLKKTEDVLKFRQYQTEYSMWREISKIQGEVQDNDRIVVFTERLFQEGLKTLINAISTFAAEESYKVDPPPKVMEEAIFKLFWQCDQLWISTSFSAGKKEFCVQKFKDFGYSEGSEQKKFCEQLIQVPNGTQFPYQIQFERIAHVLGRLNLPSTLKSYYFGTTQTASVLYQGPEIRISLEDKDLTSIIQELQSIHSPSSSPG